MNTSSFPRLTGRLSASAVLVLLAIVGFAGCGHETPRTVAAAGTSAQAAVPGHRWIVDDKKQAAPSAQSPQAPPTVAVTTKGGPKATAQAAALGAALVVPGFTVAEASDDASGSTHAVLVDGGGHRLLVTWATLSEQISLSDITLGSSSSSYLQENDGTEIVQRSTGDAVQLVLVRPNGKMINLTSTGAAAAKHESALTAEQLHDLAERLV